MKTHILVSNCELYSELQENSEEFMHMTKRGQMYLLVDYCNSTLTCVIKAIKIHKYVK